MYTDYLTDELAERTKFNEIKDAYESNDLSIVVHNGVWYIEGSVNPRLKRLVIGEMERLYPQYRYLYEGKTESMRRRPLRETVLPEKEKLYRLAERQYNNYLKETNKLESLMMDIAVSQYSSKITRQAFKQLDEVKKSVADIMDTIEWMYNLDHKEPSRNPQERLSESISGSRTNVDIVQDFIDGYGFEEFSVYDRGNGWLAIDFDGYSEDDIRPLLNRLHAWNLDADAYEHYIEIYIGDDDRFN